MAKPFSVRSQSDRQRSAQSLDFDGLVVDALLSVLDWVLDFDVDGDDESELLASDFVLADSVLLPLSDESLLAESDDFLSPPSSFLVLKSVSYQPEPLRWNAAADICFASASFLHSGQVVNGSSLNR